MGRDGYHQVGNEQDMLLFAECLCLAKTLMWPWSCGAELAPAVVAGQSPPWDAGAKATGSLVL